MNQKRVALLSCLLPLALLSWSCDKETHPRCASGETLCRGTCIPEEEGCPDEDGGERPVVCDKGFHRCDNACIPETDTDLCGVSCTPCFDHYNGVDLAGEAVCESGACGVRCVEGYHACVQGCCPDLERLDAIALTESRSCALADDSIWCWGYNTYRLVGESVWYQYTGNILVPMRMASLPAKGAALALSAAHGCALAAGKVYCWGEDDLEPQEYGEGKVLASPIQGLSGAVTAIAVGTRHSCAIDAGALFCWGSNEYGQLGDGTEEYRKFPEKVVDLPPSVTALALGGQHTCAIASGDVYCWGYGASGRVGQSTEGDAHFPRPMLVPGLSHGATALAAGSGHTCAIVDGAVLCWGGGAFGSLGNGGTNDSAVPVVVHGLSAGATALAASGAGAQSCAIVSGGAWCWGVASGSGASGDGLVPAPVPGLETGVTAIAVASSSSCALVSGRSWCWGDNQCGQLGDGTTEGRERPVPLLSP